MQKIRPREERQSGLYISIETWVHDVLEYADDTRHHRKAHRRTGRIIDPFCIAEEIGGFVVQVWMARFLVK